MTNQEDNSQEELFPEHGNAKVPLRKQNRTRYKNASEIPDRLPVGNYMPYPIDEHDAIGEYESKANIYLILAHAYNKIMDRLDELEKKQ